MIEFIDFTDIAKSVFCHTAPFTINIFKVRSLKALKFGIENKLRMSTPLVSVAFTQLC